MSKKLKGGLVAAAAIAAIGGGAAIAGATGGGDDDGTDQPITGSALDRAKAVALQQTGGQVSATEVRDEEGYYEVEVRRGDGRQVDVHLDRDFNVLDSQSDASGDEGGGANDSD